MVLEGDIDNVIEICNQHYPNVLSENICILFNLKCRKFLNMVQAAAEGKKAAETMTTDYDEYEAESLVISNNDNCMKKRINALADVDLFNCKKKKLRMHTDDELEPFREVMAYGNELKREYEETAKEDSTIKEELTVSFIYLIGSSLFNFFFRKRFLPWLIQTYQTQPLLIYLKHLKKKTLHLNSILQS